MSFKRLNSLVRSGRILASSEGVLLYNEQVNEFKPSWQQGYLTFRIFPARDPDSPDQWDPMLLQDGNYGEWVFGAPLAAGVGKSTRYTFFIQPSIDFDGDITQSPYFILYNAVKRTKSWPVQERIWYDKLFGNQGEGAELPNPGKTCWFLQGQPYFRGDKDLDPEASLNQLSVIRLSSSASDALAEEISKKSKDKDFDITAIDQSWFVTLYNASKNDPFDRTPGIPNALFYKARIDDKYLGSYNRGASGVLTHVEDRVRGLVKPWQELLHFLSFEEQAEKLEQAFRDEPDLLLFGLGDYPEYISESTRRRGGSGCLGIKSHPATTVQNSVAPTRSQAYSAYMQRTPTFNAPMRQQPNTSSEEFSFDASSTVDTVPFDDDAAQSTNWSQIN